jgi:hypothetical protein
MPAARRRTPYRILLPLASPRTARDLVRIGAGVANGRPTEITALGIVELPEGVSLSEVEKALRQLKKKFGKHWQRAELVAVGKRLCVRDKDVLKMLTSPNRGQLVFAVIALERTTGEVRQFLEKSVSQRRAKAG